MSHTSARPRHAPAAEARTLWEEGRARGGRVVVVAAVVTGLVAAANVTLAGRLSLFHDLTFVVVCLVAALAVRPRDFFAVGVLPPLLMLATVTTLAAVDRGFVADDRDGLVQAVVSGLAHHATALAIGYAAALVVLALRQVALRESGRAGARPPR